MGVRIKDNEIIEFAARGLAPDEIGFHLALDPEIIQGRFGDPDFLAALRRAQTERLARTGSRLSNAACKAADTLEGLLENPDAKIKAAAAQMILTTSLKYREVFGLEARLSEIESTMGGRDSDHNSNTPLTKSRYHEYEPVLGYRRRSDEIRERINITEHRAGRAVLERFADDPPAPERMLNETLARLEELKRAKGTNAEPSLLSQVKSLMWLIGDLANLGRLEQISDPPKFEDCEPGSMVLTNLFDDRTGSNQYNPLNSMILGYRNAVMRH